MKKGAIIFLLMNFFHIPLWAGDFLFKIGYDFFARSEYAAKIGFEYDFCKTCKYELGFEIESHIGEFYDFPINIFLHLKGFLWKQKKVNPYFGIGAGGILFFSYDKDKGFVSNAYPGVQSFAGLEISTLEKKKIITELQFNIIYYNAQLIFYAGIKW